ncbi:MAG: hypothetical protein ACRBI6_01690 [Acidimicrobiales bacterium]
MTPILAPLPLGSRSYSDVRELLAHSVDPTARWGVLQAVDDGGPIATVARWVEQTVLHETYGADPDEMSAEMAGYDPSSVWHLLIHQPSGSAVGAVRCLVGDARRFQFTSDLEEFWGLSWDDACERVGVDPLGDFVEGCSFSVLPEWRPADNLWPIKMVAAAYMHLVEDLQATAAVQIINPLVRRAFARYGIPFVSVDEPGSFEGWGEAKWDPTMSITTPGNSWFTTKDDEFRRLFKDRDERVRGGTTLPSDVSRIDAFELHERLRRGTRPSVRSLPDPIIRRR